jgi:hypothetical protein
MRFKNFRMLMRITSSVLYPFVRMGPWNIETWQSRMQLMSLS